MLFAWGLALLGAYVLTGVLGLRLAAFQPATIIWAPSGIALAALVALDRRLWPGVWLGALLVNLIAGQPWHAAAGIATGNALSAVTGVWLCARLGFDGRFKSVRAAATLLFVAAAIPFVSASAGALVVTLTSGVAHGGLWRDWYLGDVVGIVVVAPALIALIADPRGVFGGARFADSLAILVGTTIIGVAVFFLSAPLTDDAKPGAFLTLPVLLWGAMRLGAGGAALQALFLCSLALVGTLLDAGPFGGWTSPALAVRWLGLYMAVASGGTLVIACATQERRAAEAALRRGEEELLDMFESASIGMRWTDANGVVLRANRAELEMLGNEPAEHIGRHASEFHAEPAEFADIAARIGRGEIVRARHVRLRRRDGAIRDALIDASARREHGRVVAVRYFTRDVTDSMQAEGLRARLAAIVESSQDAILSMDLGGIVLSWNRGAERMFGFAADAIVGRHIGAIIPPDHAAEAAHNLARVAGGERVESFETKRMARDGRRLDVAVTISPVRDSAGRIVGLSKALRDISDRKRAEARLGLEHAITRILALHPSFEEASGETLQSVCHFLDADLACFWVVADDDERTLRAAAIFQRTADPTLTGFVTASQGMRFTRGQGLPGRVWETLGPAWITDLVHDDNFPRASAARDGGLRSGAAFPILAAGRFVGAIEWFARERLEADTSLMSMMGAIGSEIGQFVQRRRAEAAHHESESRLGLALEAGRMGVWEWDLRTNRVTWSPMLEAIHGLEPGVFPGSFDAFLSDIHSADKDRVVQAARDAVASRADYAISYRIVRPDGQTRHVEARGRLSFGEDGEPRRLTGVCTDVTDRRLAEQRVRESEARFRTLAEAAPVLIWQAGLDAKRTYFNSVWLEFTGRTLERELGDGWTESIHPEDLDRFRSTFTEAFHARRAFQMEFRLRRHDGEHRWVLDHGVPLLSRDNEFSGFIGSCIDITDRKRYETSLRESRDSLEFAVRERTRQLEESHERLRSSERMAGLGALSAGIGHDMGNLLLPLRIRLDSLERDLPPNHHPDIAAIRSCTDYLQGLASGLRMLAHDPDAAAEQGQTTDLSDWWAESSPMMRSCLPIGVVLEPRLAAGLPPLAIPPHRLTQAVFNLVQNAGRALSDVAGGRIIFEAEAAAHGWAVLRVTDNGRGMTDEVRRRCLEPFFSTKSRGVSTGLGLSIVAGIIERAQGRIEIESAPGEGACFSLLIPAATAQPAALAHTDHAARVTIADPRTRGIVISLLAGLGVGATVGEVDGADPVILWITDTQTDDDRIHGFLDGDPRRRVVVHGGPSNGRAFGVALDGGVVGLRNALRAALADAHAGGLRPADQPP